MSIKSMTWAFSQPLSGNEKVVLLALADFADDDGVCWPAIPKLAEKAYLSARTIQRIILTLSDQGYLFFERREATNGRPTSNMYRLIFDGDKLSPYGDTGDTTMVTLLSPPNEPSLEPSIEVPCIKRPREKSASGGLPKDFVPSHDVQVIAHNMGFSQSDIQSEVASMRDWAVNAGPKGRKKDWNAFCRNWFRRISKTGNTHVSQRINSKPSILERYLADSQQRGLRESVVDSE